MNEAPRVMAKWVVFELHFGDASTAAEMAGRPAEEIVKMEEEYRVGGNWRQWRMAESPAQGRQTGVGRGEVGWGVGMGLI